MKPLSRLKFELNTPEYGSRESLLLHPGLIYFARLSSILSPIWESREPKLNQPEDFRLHQVCPAFRSAGNIDKIWCDVGNIKFNT
jgi:hypothetical protein